MGVPLLVRRHLWDIFIHPNGDITMSTMASQITSVSIVYSTVCSDRDQRKHQSSASLAFVPGIHRWPVNSPHKWAITREMFPFDDVIMCIEMSTWSPGSKLSSRSGIKQSADNCHLTSAWKHVLVSLSYKNDIHTMCACVCNMNQEDV